MTLKEFSLAILLMAFLLSVAGIVEPSWWVSMTVAMLTVSSFLILLNRSYEEWLDGYEQGRLDGQMKLLRFEQAKDEERETRERMAETGGSLWKCGLDDCYCRNDFRYKEHAND